MKIRIQVNQLAQAGLLVVASGCGPKVNVTTNPFDEDLRPLAKREISAPTEAETSAPNPSLPKLREGRISRTAVNSVLDAGPASFLRDLDLQAVMEGNNFAGWQIISIVSPGSPAALADLQPQDLVRIVNGKPIGKPDQLMSVWDELRSANKLEIEVVRNQVPYLLSFQILDAANVAAPEPAAAVIQP